MRAGSAVAQVHGAPHRIGLLLAGITGATALRAAVAGAAGAASTPGALVFAAALIALTLASGTRPARFPARSLAAGAAGAAVLVAMPLLRHGVHPAAAAPAAGLAVWAPTVVLVAAAEEWLLRGALFDALAGAGGAAAVGITSAVFAAIHLPLYGAGAMPLDLAAGVWLGGLRLVSGGVSAPLTAHALADLSTGWLR